MSDRAAVLRALPALALIALFIAAPVLTGAGVFVLFGLGWTLIYSGPACLAVGIVLTRGSSRG